MIKWGLENGAKWRNVSFPARFGKNGIIGVVANSYIPPNTAIIAIPNKLIFSVDKIMKSELKELFEIEEFKYLYKVEEAGVDYEFNVLALGLLREWCKGKDSFWKPFLDTVENDYTILDWNVEDIKYIDDISLLEEVKAFRKEMEKNYRLQ